MRKMNTCFILCMLLMLCGVFASPQIQNGRAVPAGSGAPSGETSEEQSVKIVFENTHIASSRSSAVRIEGSRVTILESGIYVLRGSLADGQIVVDAGAEDEVKLRFDNLSVHCSDSAPLWIRKAGKVRIRLKEDTENVLSDGSFYHRTNTGEKQPKACIDARCDINIKGEKGSLTVTGSYGDGIYSSDDLKIKSGTIRIDARRHALYGKDSVQIEEGNLELSGKADGIHTNGSLDVQGGTIHIDAVRYGLYAFEDITVRAPADVSVETALSRYGCKGAVRFE